MYFRTISEKPSVCAYMWFKKGDDSRVIILAKSNRGHRGTHHHCVSFIDESKKKKQERKRKRKTIAVDSIRANLDGKFFSALASFGQINVSWNCFINRVDHHLPSFTTERFFVFEAGQVALPRNFPLVSVSQFF